MKLHQICHHSAARGRRWLAGNKSGDHQYLPPRKFGASVLWLIDAPTHFPLWGAGRIVVVMGVGPLGGRGYGAQESVHWQSPQVQRKHSTRPAPRKKTVCYQEVQGEGNTVQRDKPQPRRAWARTEVRLHGVFSRLKSTHEPATRLGRFFAPARTAARCRCLRARSLAR